MENEIKVGEFFRTKKGNIFKLDKYWLFNDKYKKIDIVKHSSNIIDLIQCGDYVNGECVLHIDNNTKTYGEKTIITELNNRYFGSQVIRLATKEMMESISYKVERKD